MEAKLKEVLQKTGETTGSPPPLICDEEEEEEEDEEEKEEKEEDEKEGVPSATVLKLDLFCCSCQSAFS